MAEARRPSTHVLAWFALAGNALVILQGAFVRASGSGAGCGGHWPTCNGEVVPLNANVHTLIEFTHRLLALTVLVLGVWLLVRAIGMRRETPGFSVFSYAAFYFLIMEALLGAVTVVFGLTGDNQSLARGVLVAVHLVNSLLLVGTLTGMVVFSRPRPPAWPLRLGRQGALATVLGLGLISMLVLIFSGGIAAMGNTMFPSTSLQQGFAADFNPASHTLIRLRILHPLIAITVGTYLFVGLGLSWWIKPTPSARRTAQALLGVYLAQLVVGTANLAFLAPMALQLLHLTMAVLAFALLTTLTLEMLGGQATLREGAAQQRAAMEKA
jgi:cytochrome c oxidase assembly protein subunit 15